ncbi:MAG TPA: hypothetical protein VKB38_13175 [Terracidiphilus sp.]|nr:hypothetical protein [Terracidiphilus sp.]
MNENKQPLMLPAPDMSRWIFYRKNEPTMRRRPFFVIVDPISLSELAAEMDELYKQIFGSDFQI